MISWGDEFYWHVLAPNFRSTCNSHCMKTMIEGARNVPVVLLLRLGPFVTHTSRFVNMWVDDFGFSTGGIAVFGLRGEEERFC